MRTPLAWRNLVHSKVRTAVAVAGVAFAVVLIFVQLGFLGAVGTTATLLYDALEFDIVLRSPQYLHISDTRSFPRARLPLAASVGGIEAVSPFYIGAHYWKNPHTGATRSILVMGTNPGDGVFNVPEIRQRTSLLATPRSILIDRQSRKEFGPVNRRKFGDKDVGVETEVAGNRVRIVGHYDLGTGLAADGAILLSDRGFGEVYTGRSANEVSLGLIRLAQGADVRQVVSQLREILPEDVEVVTRRQAIREELDRWVWHTSLGIIFVLGVVVALIVGTAIVYMVLSNDVASHLPEFATLKAMGYGHGFLSGIVLQQAVTLAVLGYVPGLIFSEVLYRATTYFANLPVEMTVLRLGYVFILALLMCMISGLGALGKLRSADPADLF